MQRRAFVSLLGTAATGVAASPATPFSLHPGAISRTARMVAGCQRAPTDDRALQFFKRHGVSHICGYPPDEARIAAWTVDALTRFRERCQAQGVSLDMVQIPFLSSATIDQNGRKGIMLAREPERQQEIDEACTIVRHCAAAGIPAIKYNMNLLGVLRTAPTDGRGGSRYST